jgi:hypothetical protein
LTFGIARGIVTGMAKKDPKKDRIKKEREGRLMIKVRENRLRRMAQRQGLMVQKAKLRDPYASGFGTYMLVDERNFVVAMGSPNGFGLTLDEVEEWLTSDVKS